MVRLSKIYTKVGDAGQTMLGDGAMLPKDHVRIEAYGAVDEANAAIGAAIIACAPGPIRDELVRIQHDLFDVGADLCVPIELAEKPGERLRVQPEQTARLEQRIDSLNEALAPLNSFVLPGGTPASAALHVARTTVRRAERRVASLLRAEPTRASGQALIFLNRLSDLLFVMARAANDNGKLDVLWIPGANRTGSGA